MNKHFERTGPLTELSSYPQWAQDMVADCESTKQRVLDHEIWKLMMDVRMDQESTANFMMGLWPFIERFPSFMALSLLKTRYGRSPGDNLARRWLVLGELPPHGTDGLSRWCEDICNRGTLAAGMVATNYAIEGVTGEWSQMIYDSTKYRESFDPSVRTSALKWLHLHAAYDDTHPWEALEIVCTLMGLEPSADDVAHLAECIKRSYTSMILLGDRCIQNCPDRLVLSEAAA
jgi:pyrroloquinoline quinone (PQQ) biosynthesis protein C